MSQYPTSWVINPITGRMSPPTQTGQGNTKPFTPLTNEIYDTPETNEVFVENGNNLIPRPLGLIVAALLIIGIFK